MSQYMTKAYTMASTNANASSPSTDGGTTYAVSLLTEVPCVASTKTVIVIHVTPKSFTHLEPRLVQGLRIIVNRNLHLEHILKRDCHTPRIKLQSLYNHLAKVRYIPEIQYLIMNHRD